MFLCKSRFPHLAKVPTLCSYVSQGFCTLPRFLHLVSKSVNVSTPCQCFYTLFLCYSKFSHIAIIYVKRSHTNSSESSILFHVYNLGQLFGFHIIHLSHDFSRTSVALFLSCIQIFSIWLSHVNFILEPSSQNGYKLSFQYRPFARQWSSLGFLLVSQPSARQWSSPGVLLVSRPSARQWSSPGFLLVSQSSARQWSSPGLILIYRPSARQWSSSGFLWVSRPSTRQWSNPGFLLVSRPSTRQWSSSGFLWVS